MAGSFPESPRENNSGSGSAKPNAKTFTCTNCGASVTVRYFGTSISAACQSCQSVFGLENDNYKLLEAYRTKLILGKPDIPIGTRGTLFDKEWEVIGFLVRSTKGEYSWHEYLLFNPYYGYRWLIQNQGHWNFATPKKDGPDNDLADPSFTALSTYYHDQKFSLYNSDEVDVRFVIGEFYWRVAIGQRVQALDYIHPPQMLSREANKEEINWSLSDYVEPKVVKEAFGLKSIPSRKGIGPNQPQTHAGELGHTFMAFLVFISALVLIQFCNAGRCLNADVFSKSYAFNNAQKTSDNVTPVFNLTKDNSNLELTLRATLDNSWFYVAGELVNDKTGQSFPFEKSIEYYHGYDSDGSWSEGGLTETVLLNHIPAGPYYINFDSESGSGSTTSAPLNSDTAETDKLSATDGGNQFSISAKSDVPRFTDFWIFSFLLLIPPLFTWWKIHTEEVNRWSNSDFSPYGED